VINNIDLASFIGASLEVRHRDAWKMRGERPFVFTNPKVGDGVDRIAQFVIIGGSLDAH
jgi:urease accessory protein